MQKNDSHAFSGEINDSLRNDQSGFSLIELLIALLIFAIVVAAIYGLLELGRSDRFVTNQRVEVMQNVRIALNAIGRDALNAGFEFPVGGALLPKDTLSPLLDVTVGSNTNADFLTPVIAGPDETINDLSGERTDQITFAFRDVTFNNNQLLEINSINANGSEVTLASGTNAACRVNDIYMITGTNNSAIGVMTPTASVNTIKFDGGDILDVNRPDPPNSNNQIRSVIAPASLMRIQLVTFHVLPNGTLMRTVYGNDPAVAKQTMPLAYDVENMIIEYVLSNGTVTVTPPPNNFRNVSQIQVTITARSPQTHNRSVDENGDPMEFKTTLTSVFNTRNISYFQ
jgi:prepilin-type N-terminal cleavage/methylation domain-containing protein